MSDETTSAIDVGRPGEFPPGIVCRACGKSAWRVTHTRLGAGVIRRFRTCLSCAHKVRTAERVEAESHPERDAA